MADKVALVTGAANGIGKASAKRLARDGIAIGVPDLLQEGATAVADAIESAGGKALALAADVSDRGSVQAALATAEALLLRLNIPRRLHALPPATFSGGEQQRVNLARGFIGGHPILLLDEPTASLDAANRDVVIAMIREAKAGGTAIVGIFHDPEVREAVADRVFEVAPLQEAA